MEIKKTNAMNRLFDFYGQLLTEKQRTYMALYYGEDYSLGEISENYAVSRQAVYDNIRRTEKILTHYEETLHLVDQYEKRIEMGEQLQQYQQANYADDKQLAQLIAAFIAIDDEIINEEVE